MLTRVKDILGARIESVRLTSRLTDSPACVVIGEYALSPQMEKLLRGAGQFVPESKPILELNPEHPLIQRLHEETNDSRFADFSNTLLDSAILAEGGQLEDPASFVKRFNALLLEIGTNAS